MIIHDSEGYEPGNTESLEKFIGERSQMGPVGERLHAIWYAYIYNSDSSFQLHIHQGYALPHPILVVRCSNQGTKEFSP